MEVRTETPTADVATLAAWAVARGLELEALSLARPSLEDVYLDLVGGQERDTEEPLPPGSGVDLDRAVAAEDPTATHAKAPS